MKPMRFVSAFSVCLVVILLMALAAAQSTPAVDHRLGARAQVQGLPAGAMGQPAPDGQEPPFRFREAVAYDSGGYYATSVAIADLNGDGYPDLVVANACGSPQCSVGGAQGVVSVLLGNGDGTFQTPISYASGGYAAYSAAIGDVNGDGIPDLVVTNSCLSYEDCKDDIGSGVVSVLLGNGDGTFQAAVSYSSGGSGASSVAMADVNGDGKPDVVVANRCTTGCTEGAGEEGTVGVLLNNGDGTFQPAVSYNAGGYLAQGIAAGDLTGGGRQDLVVTNLCDQEDSCEQATVGVLLGNGDGTFQPAVTYELGWTTGYAGSVVIADVNGDGHPDLVVAQSGSVSVLLGNGDGTFQPPINYNSGGYNGYWPAAAVADVNGDGYPDVAAASCEQECYGIGTVNFLSGIGQGAFGPADSRVASGGFQPTAIAIADLNGDGRPDVAAVNYCDTQGCTTARGSVGVLLNKLVLASTTTVVTSSLNPSQVGQSVTFTATVSSTRQVPDGGVVTFYHGKTKLGTGTTTNGVATLTTSFSTAGNYTIKASYPGYDYLGASSGTVKQVVKK